MSVRSVRAEIQKAMKPQLPSYESVLDASEAKRIVAKAAPGGVTQGEMNLLKDLSRRGIDPMSGAIFTEAIPELSEDQFYLPKEAKLVLDSFITMHGGNDRPAVTLAIPENPADMGL